MIAPGYDADAFELLTTKPKWRKNVRLMEAVYSDEGRGAADYRRVSGGLLVQDRDDLPQPEDDWNIVTDRRPTDDEMADLRFAWKVCRHVKSNAIVFAKGGMLLGAGAGQMSRLDSSFIAAMKAGDRSQDGVVASDAFFPFRDGIDEIAKPVSGLSSSRAGLATMRKSPPPATNTESPWCSRTDATFDIKRAVLADWSA